MPAVISCPQCHRQLRVSDEAIGRKVRCPGCSSVFEAQLGGEAAPADLGSEAPRRPPAEQDWDDDRDFRRREGRRSGYDERRPRHEDDRPRRDRDDDDYPRQRRDDDDYRREERGLDREPPPGEDDEFDRPQRLHRSRRDLGPVRTLGIVQIVVGSLFFLCGIGIGLATALHNPLKPPPNANPDEVRRFVRLEQLFEAEVPLYRLAPSVRGVTEAILALVAIIAGVGLLQTAGWARVTTILYCLCVWITEIGWLVYNFTYEGPKAKIAIHKFFNEFGVPGHLRNELEKELGGEYLRIILVSLVFLIYPTIAGICMLVPSFAARFRRRHEY